MRWTRDTNAAPWWHSSARRLKGPGLVAALLLAAWGGAQWQAWRTPALDAGQRQVLDARLQQNAAALQGSMAGLASKLGELQGRVLAMEAVRTRVTQAAGLSYTAPELTAASLAQSAGTLALPTAATPASASAPARADAGQVMDDIPARPLPAPWVGSAELLGRHIDALGRRLDGQEDAYTLVDAALSRQAGFNASLPTLSPVDYPALSSSFGWRRNPVNGRHTMHEGLDFAAPRGTPIHAASGGLVVRAGTLHGYGKMVEIDHGNGLSTRYAHASSLLVKPGDIVRQGQTIARVGSTGRSTGSHLHFEVRMADYPLDPTLFIQQDAQTRLALGAARVADGGPPADAGATRLR